MPRLLPLLLVFGLALAGCDAADTSRGECPGVPGCEGGSTPHTVAISLDPAATYLRTHGDPEARDAVAYRLSDYDIEPGDVVYLAFEGHAALSNTGYSTDDMEYALAVVFSGSNTLLASDNKYRVVDSIYPGDDNYYITPSTINGAYETDIEDDAVSDKWTLTVPAGAEYMFFTIPDSYYGDNTGDVEVKITVNP